MGYKTIVEDGNIDVLVAGAGIGWYGCCISKRRYWGKDKKILSLPRRLISIVPVRLHRGSTRSTPTWEPVSVKIILRITFVTHVSI